MKDLTPTASYDTVRCPENGDAAEQAAWEPGLQELTDHDAYLLARADGQHALVMAALCPVTIVQPLIGHEEGAYAAQYHFTTGSLSHFTSDSTNANEYLYLPLSNLVHGATLQTVSVAVDGGTSYSGTPASVNSYLVYREEFATGSTWQIGSANDPATYGGAPDMTDYRLITTATIGEVIDLETYRYYVLFWHESGANAHDGVRIFGCRVTLLQPS